MSTKAALTNTLLAVDLLLTALELKEKFEEQDLKFVAKLRTAIAEERDLTDEEVDEFKLGFMHALQEWERL